MADFEDPFQAPAEPAEAPSEPVAQAPPAPAVAPPAPAQPPRAALQVDDSKVVASYSNFCRLTGTPEELIIDFGLNPQPIGVSAEPVVLTHRIVTSFHTAKRLWQALHLTLQRHEAAFGALETDVQKRIVPKAQR